MLRIRLAYFVVISMLLAFNVYSQNEINKYKDHLDRNDLSYISRYVLDYPIHSDFREIVESMLFYMQKISKDSFEFYYHNDTSFTINSFFNRLDYPIDSNPNFIDLGFPDIPFDAVQISGYQHASKDISQDQEKEYRLEAWMSNIIAVDTSYYIGLHLKITDKEYGMEDFSTLVFRFRKFSKNGFITFEKVYYDYYPNFYRRKTKENLSLGRNKNMLNVFARVVNLKTCEVTIGHDSD